jgi:hypothetical protein
MAIDHGPRAVNDDGRQEDRTEAAERAEHDAALRAYVLQLVAESIHAPPTVADESVCALERWRVLECRGEQFFVGYNRYDGEGRVSSPIRELDPRARVGVTASGRHYVLLGASGQDPDADYVLRWWLRVNRVKPSDVRDVTTEVIPTPGEEPRP